MDKGFVLCLSNIDVLISFAKMLKFKNFCKIVKKPVHTIGLWNFNHRA